ncbi:MAG: crossover junction endodeoxyribonuclease RuvC, partial [Acidobacteriota bacterium]
MKRILGIDPGSVSTGYGIIETDGSTHRAVVFGALRTPARQSFHYRLLHIYTELDRLLAGESVDVLAIEDVFYATNVQSALRLGHAGGPAPCRYAEDGSGRIGGQVFSEP